MQLIAPLIAGVRGAENGHAEVYKRGTSTRATYYASFEGQGGISSGGNISLDAFGGAEVYVDELVDVKVVASDGTAIRNFTAGEAASNVEVVSTAFTGTDYETALSAVSKPAVLEAILDLWIAQNLAPDWKIKVGGTTDTIVSFLSQVVGLVINVKDPQYGATGDRTTDDYTALAAAHNAATAGQIIYYPPGTYRSTQDLPVADDVTILGAGPDSSIISIDSATENGLTVTGDGTKVASIVNIGIQAEQGNSGSLIKYSGNPRLRIAKCKLNADGNFEKVIDDTGTDACDIAIEDSEIGVGLDYLFYDDAADADVHFAMDRCEVTTKKTTLSVEAVVRGSGLRIRNCIFDGSSLTSGDVVYVRGNGGANWCLVEGNVFKDAGGATMNGVVLENPSSGYRSLEISNVFGSSVDFYGGPAGYAAGSFGDDGVWASSREQYGVTLVDASTATAVSIDTMNYRTVMIEKQNPGTGTITVTIADTPFWAPTTIIFYNNNGTGNLDLTFAGSNKNMNGAPWTVGNGQAIAITFIRVDTGDYVQIGTPALVTM